MVILRNHTQHIQRYRFRVPRNVKIQLYKFCPRVHGLHHAHGSEDTGNTGESLQHIRQEGTAVRNDPPDIRESCHDAVGDHIQYGAGCICGVFVDSCDGAGNTIRRALLCPAWMNDREGMVSVQFFHNRVQRRIPKIHAASIGRHLHAKGAFFHTPADFSNTALDIRQRKAGCPAEAVRLQRGQFIIDLNRCLQGFFIISVMDMGCGQGENRVVNPRIVHKLQMHLPIPLRKRKAIIGYHINIQQRQPFPKSIRHRMRMKIYRHIILLFCRLLFFCIPSPPDL